MKETYYFEHDYNARGDEKIVKLLRIVGPSGYGIYWMLIEKIYEARGMLQADYETLSFDLHADAKDIESVVTSFGLFYTKGNRFGSRSVDRRLKKWNEKRKQARLAGLASARANKRSTTVEQPLYDRSTHKVSKVSKVNEDKVSKETTPFKSLFCSYNDNGQGPCSERRDVSSKYCPEHKLKVRDKFLMKQEKKNSLPELKAF